jgi:hypothetical protein
MPAYIVKDNPGEDFYVMWSDITESPYGWGTRAEMESYDWSDPKAVESERFERADRTGCSAMWPSLDDPIYGWTDSGFIYQQQGHLPRAKLRELCARLEVDQHADVRDLLEPFEDS